MPGEPVVSSADSKTGAVTSAHESKRRVLKIECGGEIHRQPFPVAEGDLYAALVRHVQTRLGPNRAFSLGYRDSDDDFVSISSMLDLAEALGHVGSRTLKVIVNEHNYDILQLEDADGSALTIPPTPDNDAKRSNRGRFVPTPDTTAQHLSLIKSQGTQIVSLEGKLKMALAEIETLKKALASAR
jgi:hypothetical protein